MPGGNTTSTQQSSTTAPWAAAQPLLQNIIGSLGNTSTKVTPGQQQAGQTLTAEAASTPSFAAPASAGVTGLLGGGGANTYSPILSSAYSAMGSELSPLLNPSNLNPMNTPGFSTALSTVNNDITNQVNSEFAAAGRDMSPANTTALARGLSQGEGGLLAGQYNTNVSNLENAANQYFNAGNSTATGLTGFNQLGNQNILSGIGGAGAIPGLTTAPGATQLGAANTVAQQPFQNIGWLSSLAYPLGAMGGTSSGTGTTTQQTSPWSTVIGAGLGAAGLMTGNPALMLGGLGAIGGGLPGSGGNTGMGGWGQPQWSDVRLKEDVKPVGMLFDKTPVFSYRYIGDDTPRIGLLAQDIEQRRPDAVVEFGPARIKAVDYGKATERSREIGGLLSDMAMAA